MKDANFKQAHENSLKFQEQIIAAKHNMENLINDLAEQLVTVADCEILAAMIAERPDAELSSIARLRKQNPELVITKKFNLVDLIDEPATSSVAEETTEQGNDIILEFTTKEVEITPEEIEDAAKEHAKESAKKQTKAATERKPRVRREPICLHRHKIEGACDILIEVVRPTRQEEKEYEKIRTRKAAKAKEEEAEEALNEYKKLKKCATENAKKNDKKPTKKNTKLVYTINENERTL